MIHKNVSYTNYNVAFDMTKARSCFLETRTCESLVNGKETYNVSSLMLEIILHFV